MFFGILFAVVVEITPLALRSSMVGIIMFMINCLGGNLPVLVDPVAKQLGYRESLAIFHAGSYGISNSQIKLMLCQKKFKQFF